MCDAEGKKGESSASQRVKAPNGQSNWYHFSRHSCTSRSGPLRSAFCRRMLLSKPIRGLPRVGQHIEVLCGSSRTSGWRTALVVRNDAAKRRSIIKWSDGEPFTLCPDVSEQNAQPQWPATPLGTPPLETQQSVGSVRCVSSLSSLSVDLTNLNENR